MSAFLLAAFLALPAGEPALKPAYPKANLLIEPAELRQALERKDPPLLFDCRALEAHRRQSIKGAMPLSPADWSEAFAKGEPIDAWETRFRQAGVEDLTRTIVVFDDNKSKDAARIWWILQRFGCTDVRLLNGGWRGWKAAQFPTQAAVATASAASLPGPSAKTKLQPAELRHATKQDLLALLQANPSGALFIDARSEAEHCGTQATAKRNGAIPGAKHLEWSDLLDAETHRFKPAEVLRKLFADAGIVLNRPLIAYCQSGGRASVMAFALELMGAKEVKNYYAGWAEWGNDPNTPIEPGKPKRK